ncbi:MAG: hypothetical protein IKP56_01730, partial [Bacilli bacterium]|nr:hypothetical protein [Bacilli bacterium]
MKKRLVLVPFASMLLSSCFWPTIPDWDTDKTFRFEAVPIVNMASDDYDIIGEELNIWFVDDSDVPYVDIKNFFNAFDGFFDTENIYYNFAPEFGYVVLRYQDTFRVFIDWSENTIYSGSYDDFPWYSYQGASTNYSEHLYATNDYYDRDAVFFLDAGKYGFDILYKNKTCIVPLFLMNTLFCSTSGFNVFYNGEKCFATAGEMRSLDEYYECESNKKTQSDDMRNAAVNSLCLVMDTFYGLSEDKGFKNDGFRKHIEKDTLDYLLSKGSLDNYSGYKKLIYGYLDELHTRIDLPSYYCDISKAERSAEDMGERYTEFYARRDSQRELRNSSLSDLNEVRYEDDLAIITLDAFETGAQANIYDENGNVKEDAWQHDSYWYMHKCMQDITAHPEVSKVVLDLSLNGGGNLGAMERVAGFMTDEKIPCSTYDILDNEYTITDYYVDIDRDGNYGDDAYDDYDWYLLTGVNTYSAANFMA